MLAERHSIFTFNGILAVQLWPNGKCEAIAQGMLCVCLCGLKWKTVSHWMDKWWTVKKALQSAVNTVTHELNCYVGCFVRLPRNHHRHRRRRLCYIARLRIFGKHMHIASLSTKMRKKNTGEASYSNAALTTTTTSSTAATLPTTLAMTRCMNAHSFHLFCSKTLISVCLCRLFSSFPSSQPRSEEKIFSNNGSNSSIFR